MTPVTDHRRLGRIAEHFTPKGVTQYKVVTIGPVKESPAQLVVELFETFPSHPYGPVRRTVRRSKYLHIGGPLDGQHVATPESDEGAYVGYSANSWRGGARSADRYVFVHASLVAR